FCRKVSGTGDLYDCVVEDAVPFEPVSPCNFGKCREILTKCRETTNITQPKAIRSQKLRFDSPYSRTRETILPEQGGVKLDAVFRWFQPQSKYDTRVRSKRLCLDP